MNFEMTDSSEHLTANTIVKFEKNVGCLIPPSYRKFLLIHNGGKPNPCEFTIVGKNNSQDAIAVKYFLGINFPEKTLNLEYVLSAYYNRLPSNLFPIARDPGGNLICIATTGTNIGKVYFWEHEFEVEDGEIPSYENVYFIADSFEEFLSMLS